MSSNIHNLPNPFNADIDGDIRVAIISAEWNSHITDALTEGCVRTLEKHGVSGDMIDIFRVPEPLSLPTVLRLP